MLSNRKALHPLKYSTGLRGKVQGFNDLYSVRV
jgi:hypothetical protein